MFFTALERQEFKEPQKWWIGSSHLFQEFTESIAKLNQTHKATNIDSSRSCVFSWCWAGRANSWSATVPPFILTKPPSHQQAPVCSYTYRTAFSMWGAPWHFKAPRVGAPVGWQAATAQLSRIALVNARQTHVGDWVLANSGFDYVTEWNRLMLIKIQITVSNQVEAGNAFTCVVCLSTPWKIHDIITGLCIRVSFVLFMYNWLLPKGNATMHSFSVTLLPQSEISPCTHAKPLIYLAG